MSRAAARLAAAVPALLADLLAGLLADLLAGLSAALPAAVLLAACAGTGAPPPGATLTPGQLSAIRPGQSTRATLLAALGPTHKVVFDNGMETWLYQLPAASGVDEVVVLLDADGVVRKLRRRAHGPAPAAAR